MEIRCVCIYIYICTGGCGYRSYWLLIPTYLLPALAAPIKTNRSRLQRYHYIDVPKMAPETTGADKTAAVRSCNDFGWQGHQNAATLEFLRIVMEFHGNSNEIQSEWRIIRKEIPWEFQGNPIRMKNPWEFQWIPNRKAIVGIPLEFQGIPIRMKNHTKSATQKFRRKPLEFQGNAKQ